MKLAVLILKCAGIGATVLYGMARIAVDDARVGMWSVRALWRSEVWL